MKKHKKEPSTDIQAFLKCIVHKTGDGSEWTHYEHFALEVMTNSFDCETDDCFEEMAKEHLSMILTQELLVDQEGRWFTVVLAVKFHHYEYMTDCGMEYDSETEILSSQIAAVQSWSELRKLYERHIGFDIHHDFSERMKKRYERCQGHQFTTIADTSLGDLFSGK